MKINIYYTDLLILAGALLSFLMAFAFIIKLRKHFANLWITGFLTASFVVIIIKFLYHTGYIIDIVHLTGLNFPIGLLRPVFMYLYVYYLLNNVKTFRWTILLHFIPALLLVIYLLPYFMLDASAKESYLISNNNDFKIIPASYVVFQYLYSFIYIGLIFYERKKFILHNPKMDNQKIKVINWIDFLWITGLIFLFTSGFLRLFEITGNFNYYHYILFSLLLIILSIKLLTLPELVNLNPADHQKYAASSLSENKKKKIFERLQWLMTEEKTYRKENLKLADLAEKLMIHANQLSQIINEQTGNSFNDFVNMYRVEEAKRLLSLQKSNLSIEGIAYDAGFNSRAAFYKAFKKITQITPSQFKNISG